VENEASQRSAVPSVAHSAPLDDQRGITSSGKELDADTEPLKEPTLGSMQSYPGSDLLLLLVFQAAHNLGLVQAV